MQYLIGFLAAAAAVKALPNPVPQAVTAQIAPSGAMPAGCMADWNGWFGIAVMTGSAGAAQATEAPDGQPAAASQYQDGQPRAGAVNQISDGQVQAMTQIKDGQIQAPMPTCAASQISDGQPQDNCMMPTPTAAAVSQITDGQIQATTGAAMQITDGQVQATTAAAQQITDGQVHATAVGTQPDSQPTSGAEPAGMSSGMTACANSDTLEMMLKGGVLTDSKGRTGYIASNYQFQFDEPPQAGAIYTAGFSVCPGGILALGDSKMFYRCRSGDFYNLYNENWAPQCQAVTIKAVSLVNC